MIDPSKMKTNNIASEPRIDNPVPISTVKNRQSLRKAEIIRIMKNPAATGNISQL